MKTAAKAYIGLGSNLGEREKVIRQAAEYLRKSHEILSIRLSSLSRWPALGCPEQPEYLNAAAEIVTTASARRLLELLQETEKHFGRQRNHRWEARTLDLDLLLYENLVLDEPDLTIPHPQMHLRSFVLNGLLELNPHLCCPRLKRPLRVLADRLNHSNYVLEPARFQLISIGGLIGVGKSTLAERLAPALGGRLIREEYDKNPFLEKVYSGQTNLALDSELFFLNSSVTQLQRDGNPCEGLAVSDYVFFKSLIYARQWLDEESLARYRRIYDSVIQQVQQPVLVLYLQDTAADCLARIRRRRRPFEQGIKLDFLESQQRMYEEILAGWTICPVIRLDASECVRPEQIPPLAKEVSYYLAGKCYGNSNHHF